MSGKVPKGKLVETGAFRIDRRRAIEKLQRFQLPNRGEGVYLWIRVANACGASAIDFRIGVTSMEVSFDGVPLRERELRDPYAALEGSEGSGRRGRLFALGLLHAMREKPASLTVSSGTGKNGFTLSSPELGRERVTKRPRGSTRTVVRLKWSFWSRKQNTGPFAPITVQLGSRVAMSRARIRVNGVEAERRFEEGEAKGHLPGAAPSFRRFAVYRERGAVCRHTIPAYVSGEKSRVEVFTGGVRSAVVRRPRGFARLQSWVNDDGLTLNAALTGIARNRRFHDLFERLRDQEARFLTATVRDQRRRMKATGKLLIENESMRYLWKQRFVWGASVEKPGSLVWVNDWFRSLIGDREGAKRHRAAVARVLWDARATLWLREAAQRMQFNPNKKIPKVVEKALLAAPVAFNALGEPLSVSSLLALKKAAWGVIYTTVPAEKPSPRARKTVWCVSSKDSRWLKTFLNIKIARFEK
jgi:hypothetical protein